MSKLLKIKKFFFVIIIIFILILIDKSNFIKNFFAIFQFDYDKRIENVYGYCGNESIGYLKDLKKKFNFKTNPKIINYKQTQPVNWSIFEAKYVNKKSKYKILLNYPGNEISINTPYFKNNKFKLKKNVYLLPFVSKEIIKFSLDNVDSDKIKIEFYNINDSSNFKKINSKNLTKAQNESVFILNNKNNILGIGDKDLYIEIIDDNKNLNKDLKLIFQNLYFLENLKILDNHKNCYLIKND